MGFLVAQMGARMHYAIPRILSEHGMLSCFFTDLVSSKCPLRYMHILPRNLLPGLQQKLSRRVPQGLDNCLIRAFTLFGLKYTVRLHKTLSQSEATATHLRAGNVFTALVNAHARWGDIDAVYAFNSAALGLFVEARKREKRTILEQTIAPRFVQQELLMHERVQWPGWSDQNGKDVNEQEFCERELAEWEAADVILCGSDFVKDGIVGCAPHLGGKCAVVPYGVDNGGGDNVVAPRLNRVDSDRLRVLAAGVSLRKGTPYVIQAAKKLRKLAEFKLAGLVSVDASVLQNLPPNVEILGHVGKQEMVSLYSWADVFLLPSICEGSATVTYEAISMGVPIICTPNTGSVIRNGIEGYIIPVASSEAICEKLMTILNDPTLLSLMSCQALERSREFSLAAYGTRLLNALL